MSRKSQTSDSVLSHPMLWLDERIFGWNRSAAVGQSVWGTSHSGRDRSRSNPPTAPASPAESDDEQEEADVDYDDVLAVIDTGRRSFGGDAYPDSPRAGRKRGGRSYHDLQNLREERDAKSPRGGGTVPLPKVKGDEETTRLTMRKNRQEADEQGLGLQAGDGEKDE